MCADRLTVLITTSPAYTHPSTCLLDQVLATFAEVPYLIECRTIIICDGYRITEELRFKKGRVTEEQALRYEEYKTRLKAHVAENNPLYTNTTILELPQRVGFGFALQKAMPMVTTPYVMVVQHDRSFIKPFDLLGILSSMEAHPIMRYVLMPMASTMNYHKRMDTKFRLRNVLAGREVSHEGRCFLPLCQFYDSTHIAHVDFYEDFVFGQRMIPPNGFIEDRVGQLQVRDIRENGMEAHAKYGTYLFGDGFEYLVQHLDGRDTLTEGQFSWHRDEQGLCRRVIHNVPFYTREERATNESRIVYCDYEEATEGGLDMFSETS